MNPESVRSHLRLLDGGRSSWADAASPWASDLPDPSSTDVHVPGLTEMPIQWDEGPPWRSKSYHVPAWYRGSDKRRIALLRRYVKEYGRDPRLRQFVIKWVLQPRGVLFPSRQFEAQAQAILAWVQENIAYVNEPGELLQSPWTTLKLASGDCDDSAQLICAMAESIGLGNRFVLGGKTGGGKPVRWHEGQGGPPMGAKFFHLYCDLGWPALAPKKWKSAEATMRVPLGHDVVKHGIPRGLTKGVDVSGWGVPGGGEGFAPGWAPTPGWPSRRGTHQTGLAFADSSWGLPDLSPAALSLGFKEHLPAIKQYGKDVFRLALIGATAQILLFLFLRSRLGARVKGFGKKALRSNSSKRRSKR